MAFLLSWPYLKFILLQSNVSQPTLQKYTLRIKHDEASLVGLQNWNSPSRKNFLTLNDGTAIYLGSISNNICYQLAGFSVLKLLMCQMILVLIYNYMEYGTTSCFHLANGHSETCIFNTILSLKGKKHVGNIFFS